MIRPAMVPAIMLGTIWTFNNFSVIYFISKGGPFGRTEILITQAFKLVFEQRLYGVAAAFSFVVAGHPAGHHTDQQPGNPCHGGLQCVSQPSRPFFKQIGLQLFLLSVTITVLFPILWILSLALDPRNIDKPLTLTLIPPGRHWQPSTRVLFEPFKLLCSDPGDPSSCMTFGLLLKNSLLVALGHLAWYRSCWVARQPMPSRVSSSSADRSGMLGFHHPDDAALRPPPWRPCTCCFARSRSATESLRTHVVRTDDRLCAGQRCLSPSGT